MFDVFLVMVYAGGFVAVFKFAADSDGNKDDIFSSLMGAVLWPVLVTAFYVENFVRAHANTSMFNWFVKKSNSEG